MGLGSFITAWIKEKLDSAQDRRQRNAEYTRAKAEAFHRIRLENVDKVAEQDFEEALAHRAQAQRTARQPQPRKTVLNDQPKVKPPAMPIARPNVDFTIPKLNTKIWR